jgi:2-polyprenyl-3-methyl-5-hydroxy-6-metoxy-1,4-benzoquinol methylase
MNRKEHWENIYNTKQLNEVSWYQPTPQQSLDWIQRQFPHKDAAIIDIGGGDSFLPDHLIDLGYSNITVLDISERAIDRAKERLGEKANKVNWVISDIIHFTPLHQYDGWHDRAAFHFLRDPQEIHTYKRLLESTLKTGGKAMIGTFSENGPLKCSGIEIQQYSKDDFERIFGDGFEVGDLQNVDHPTPFNTTQNFNFIQLKLQKD